MDTKESLVQFVTWAENLGSDGSIIVNQDQVKLIKMAGELIKGWSIQDRKGEGGRPRNPNASQETIKRRERRTLQRFLERQKG